MTPTQFDVVSEAANEGDPDAMYRLGMMYAQGDGVGKDEGQAGRWLFKAAEKGQKEAAAVLREMGNLTRGWFIVSRNRNSSPDGYSYESKRNITGGKGMSLVLNGWGSENAGTYQAGLYTVEVWCDGLCLRSEKIRMK